MSDAENGGGRSLGLPNVLWRWLLVLVLAGQGLFLWLASRREDDATGAAISASGSLLTWTEAGASMGGVAGLVVALIGIAAGFTLLKRWPWLVLALAAPLLLFIDLTQGRAPTVTGQADTIGVTWTSGEKTVGRHAWSEATELQVGCFISEDRKGRKQDPQLLYAVRFGAEERRAELDRQAAYDPARRGLLPRWLRELEPVDAAVRATPGLKIVGTSIEADCMRRYGELLDAADRARFEALFKGAQPAN